MGYHLEVFRDNPFGYWRFLETSGAAPADSSGFGRNGVMINSPVLNEFPIIAEGERSILFTGTNYMIRGTVSQLIKGKETNACSYEIWLRANSRPVARWLVFGSNDAGIYVTKNQIEFALKSTNGITYTADYTVPDWNANYHVVASYGAGKMVLWVNGVMVADADFVGSISNVDPAIYVGGPGTQTNGFLGWLDDPAIYTRVLSAARIEAHYAAGTRNMNQETVIIGDGGEYYSMSDESASVAIERGPSDWTFNSLTNMKFEDGAVKPVYQEQPAGTNLMTNPSFEETTTHWSLYAAPAGSTSTRSTDRAYSGQYSMAYYVPGDTTSSLHGLVFNNSSYNGRNGSPLGLAGQTMTVSMWIYPVVTGTFQVILRDDNANDSSAGTALTANSLVLTAGSWQRFVLTYTVKADRTISSLYVTRNQYTGPATVLFYLDAVQVEAGSTATPYMDANLGEGYSSDFLNVKNLVPNPTFDTDLTNWSPGFDWTMVRDTAVKLHGSASLAATAGTAPSQYFAYTVAPRMTVTPDTVYTASAYMRGSVAKSARLGITWYDEAGAELPETTSIIYTLSTTAFSRFTCTATSPPTAVSCRLIFRLISPATGDIVYLDSVLFEERGYATTFSPMWVGETTSSRAEGALAFTGGSAVTEHIDIGNYGIIDGSRISWDTVADLIVETSIDGGTTWSVANNNAEIPSLVAGYDATDKSLMIRVTAVSSSERFESILSNLKVVIYSSKDQSANIGITAAVNEPAVLGFGDQNLLHNTKNVGSKFTLGKFIVPSSPDRTVKAVEFWIRRRGTQTSSFIMDARAAEGETVYIWIDGAGAVQNSGLAAAYANGANTGGPFNISHFPLNRWSHIYAVLATPTPNPIHLLGRFNNTSYLSADIANVVVYETDIGAANVLEHYNSALGRNKISVTDTTIPTMPEVGYLVYRYPWQIQGAGG